MTPYALIDANNFYVSCERVRTVSVAVRGERIKEGNETFFVNLSAPGGATLLDGQGLRTIL